MKLSIILNKKYNRLIPLRVSGKQNGHTTYECLCDCGKIIITKGISIKSGHTKSCGCYEKELLIKRNTLPKGQASFNYLFNIYKRNAKTRNYIFDLSKEQFKELTSNNCHYCNSEPTSYIRPSKYTNGSYISNGVDRIDNNIGYILTNCVPCCTICNRAKGKMSYNDFKNWINKFK